MARQNRKFWKLYATNVFIFYRIDSFFFVIKIKSFMGFIFLMNICYNIKIMTKKRNDTFI